MSAPGKAYSCALLPKLRIDDDNNVWTFVLPGLPLSSGLVKTVSICTENTKHSMSLRLERCNNNRAIEVIPRDQLLLLSLEGFRSIIRGSVATDTAHPAPDLQPRTAREVSDYCIKLARAGITINNVCYNFYGHSNSQLKSRSCFFIAAPKEEISRRIEAMGDFSKMKTVGKKAKRIGLLFSSAKTAMTVSPDRVEDIADVETVDYCFTDGCGLVAPSLAQELARRTRIIFRNQRYTPAVFQIRYRGYKGVVTIDTRMAKQQTLLKLRKSMKKFSGGTDYSFAVVDYSKPFSYGFLNDETIILLHSLGISSETLLRKQNEHFDLLRGAETNFRDAFRFLSCINRPELAERMLLDGIESVKPQIRRLINAELGKMVNKRDEQRCRIFVPKSRLLFGVCDAWDVLKEGECAVRVTMEGDGLPYTLKGTEVTVIRNPCLHPGDWQKFKVVERPELSRLVDCIVFSTKGRRPAADLMSGGDLDGDQFFVCWDPELIPSTVSSPALYPGGRDPILFRPITTDDRLVYFAKYTNASLGQVKNLYLDWARASGPLSAPCQELNRLFSQCVDGNRTKIPEKLRNCPKNTQETTPFILDVLHEDANRQTFDMRASTASDLTGFDVDAIHLLLGRGDVAMSEFDFVKLTHMWCQKNRESFEDLLHFFDFNVLNEEQKAWVLSRLPMSLKAPASVMNALCTSSILQQTELQQFHLEYPGIRWKRVYDSSIDRLATLHESITTNLAMFQRTLLVIRPDERLTVAIYIPRIIEPSMDCLIDDTGRLFAFPHTQGSQRQARLTRPTKMSYQLYCDGNVFQLFEKQRANSWIYLARPGKNDEEYRHIQDQGERRRKRQEVINRGSEAEVCASIALDKFSKQLQTHIGRVNRSPILAAEIYVISNRDTASMHRLDLWLEYVDTVEKLPLFPREAKKFSIPTRQNVLSSMDPSWLHEVIAHKNYSALAHLESIEQYRLLFATLRRINDNSFLLECFRYILKDLDILAVDPKALLHNMIAFLALEPVLVVVFTPFFAALSKNEVNVVRDVLEVSVVPILKALVLSANTMGNLVLDPLETLMANLPRGGLLLDDVAAHIELISLTIRSTDLALDMLLGCLQPHAEGFLMSDSKVVQHLLHNITAIAIDHIEEAGKVVKQQQGFLDLRPDPSGKDSSVVEAELRIDVSATPKISSHVRLVTASSPENKLIPTAYSMDALVVFSETGRVRFTCLHPLPSYYTECSWVLHDCGPFVTTKATIDAVRDCCVLLEDCCRIANILVDLPSPPLSSSVTKAWQDVPQLNLSQNQAIRLALNSQMICLWGPPGTGKTETIVEMICALQTSDQEARVLVTAPTHNAVDNVMRRYLQRLNKQPLARKSQPTILRVSTEVRKVAEDLRQHTCDAMAGTEVNTNQAAKKKAIRMVQRSDTIFTTCIGAGIGLLRGERFDISIVDEASQQTEPTSLVPLVKGCSKAILVGDHVQLRPTVQQTALALGFDVSLFERLYTTKSAVHAKEGCLTNMMLDTQYRMHPKLCEFSSKEFYGGELKTGIDSAQRPLPTTGFPFPAARTVPRTEISGTQDHARTIFIECMSSETLGNKSKENKGQADLCIEVCKLLRETTSTPVRGPASSPSYPEVVVLTPYTRQADLMKRMLSGLSLDIEVSSIDGFQGREADFVVFVTVRCNEHRNIGFLKDVRRLNVALTRAKTALIVIGNRATLTEGTADEASASMWKRLLGGLVEVKL